jgi:hypothetical protein
MMSKFLPAALLLALAGCATTADAGQAGEAISYETGPCFGACPVYKVKVSPDGSGTFEGRRFTAATGTRNFQLTPAQYRAFAAQLAPVRPARGTVRYAGETCRMMATDLPSAEVVWSGSGEERRLYFYFGCDMERNRALAERIRAAPRLLPIADLIGRPGAAAVERP